MLAALGERVGRGLPILACGQLRLHRDSSATARATPYERVQQVMAGAGLGRPALDPWPVVMGRDRSVSAARGHAAAPCDCFRVSQGLVG